MKKIKYLLAIMLIAVLGLGVLACTPTGGTNTHTVTLVLNGGTIQGGKTVYTVDDGKLFTRPTSPTKNLYDFDDWYPTEACSGEAFDFTKPITKDTKIYAGWKAPSFEQTSALNQFLANLTSNNMTATVLADLGGIETEVLLKFVSLDPQSFEIFGHVKSSEYVTYIDYDGDLEEEVKHTELQDYEILSYIKDGLVYNTNIDVDGTSRSVSSAEGLEQIPEAMSMLSYLTEIDFSILDYVFDATETSTHFVYTLKSEIVQTTKDLVEFLGGLDADDLALQVFCDLLNVFEVDLGAEITPGLIKEYLLSFGDTKVNDILQALELDVATIQELLGSLGLFIGTSEFEDIVAGLEDYLEVYGELTIAEIFDEYLSVMELEMTYAEFLDMLAEMTLADIDLDVDFSQFAIEDFDFGLEFKITKSFLGLEVSAFVEGTVQDIAVDQEVSLSLTLSNIGTTTVTTEDYDISLAHNQMVEITIEYGEDFSFTFNNIYGYALTEISWSNFDGYYDHDKGEWVDVNLLDYFVFDGNTVSISKEDIEFISQHTNFIWIEFFEESTYEGIEFIFYIVSNGENVIIKG